MSYIVQKREAARFFSVSTQALDGWFDSGCPVAERSGNGNIKGVALDVMARWRHERDTRREDEQPPGCDTNDVEKTLLIREQRIGQELKNAQTRRELAPIEMIGWTLAKVGSQISAILESIPLKIKTILPRLSAAEVEHIRREIVKAQNAAASVSVNLDEYYGRSPAADRITDPLGAEDS